MANTSLIYGPSGSYKSTAGAHFSHYIYEKTGKATLLFSQDGGGWQPMQPEIDAGIIVPYRCTTENVLPIIRKISQGYWPENPNEHQANLLNMKRVDWSKFGGLICEGLTSISQTMMRYLVNYNIKAGQEPGTRFQQKILIDGQVLTEDFGSSSMGHYGFVQNAIYDLVTNMSGLPCQHVLFTALESRTEDDDRSTIFGPQISGKKATALAPSWVGDCLHAQDFAVKQMVSVPDPQDPKKMIETEIVKTVVRTYFTKHPDPTTGIMFPAKPRCTSEQIPALMKAYPGGYYDATLKDGIDKYLSTVDGLNKAQTATLGEWRAKIDEKFKLQRGQTTSATVGKA